MKVSSLNNYSPTICSFKHKMRTTSINTTDTVSFSGLKNKESQALFVFDLDGTLAEGSNDNIEEILKLKNEKQAILTYATGQTLKEFTEFQKKNIENGINIPTPKYLIANNGQFIYENIDGKLVEDTNWTQELTIKTGFNRDEVGNIIKALAQKPENRFDDATLDKLCKQDDFQKRKEIDGAFWNSKISYYEWNPSPFMLEYFVSSDVNMEKLQKTTEDILKPQGKSAKFVLNKYPKKVMDKCPENILLKARPFREDQDGAMAVFFVCAADKADGVEYVKNKLKIPNSEILMAGNDSNDISLANLTKKGSFFICVSNATDKLKEVILKLKSHTENKFPDNLINVKKPGASGIIEGIHTI